MFFVYHETRNMQTRLASARITCKFTHYGTNNNVGSYNNFEATETVKICKLNINIITTNHSFIYERKSRNYTITTNK